MIFGGGAPKKDPPGGGAGIEDEMLMIFGADANVIGLWFDIESAVYKELRNNEVGGQKNGS